MDNSNFSQTEQTFTLSGDKKVLTVVLMIVGSNLGAFIGSGFTTLLSVPFVFAGIIMGIIWGRQKYIVTSEAVKVKMLFLTKTFLFSDYLFIRKTVTGAMAYLQTMHSPGDILILKRAGRRDKRLVSMMSSETFESMWQAIKQQGARAEE